MNATVLPPVATPTRAVIAAPGSPALVEPSSASPLAATAGRSSAGPGPAGRNAPGGDDSAMPKSRPSMRRQGLHGESEERLRELERELQEGEVALREKRAALEVATAAHLIEGTKLGKKLAAVRELTQMMDELHGEVAQCAEAEAEAEATLALQEEVVAARQADVDAAVARTRELQDSLEAAQLEAREAHAYAGRMADQALVAMRDAERGRARGRRAKEQVEVERVRAAEARRRVAPLEEPVAAAEEEYEALEEGAAELEARALETRGRLEAAAEAEFALQRKYEELLRLQPVLLKRREEGYLALEGVRREHERLVDAIKMQQYQDAFFGRQHRKVTSLVDGGVLESVGLRKTMAWEDPWDAERGVGPWVVRIALGELVYAIEERAVVECGDALTRVKAEYEQQHELAIELRSANEDDLTEARVEREAADRARTALEGARAKLEATQAEVEGLEARYEGLWRAMEETLEQAEELARATERANADRGASRVSADVLALAAEDMEAGVPEAHAAEGARRAALVAEEAALPAMRAALAARRGAREEAEARVAGAERGIGVRGAEAEFQAARRAREEARRDRAAGEARRCAHALGELRRAAQEERALLAFASTVPEAARALADLRAHATAMQVEAYAREARAGAARGARGAADAAVADGLFEAAALRHRASLIAAEQAAERAASREAVARPAVRGGAAPPLHFARWARVFAPGPDGPATLVRAAPSARAVGVRGWVASPPARSGGGGGGGFTALGSRALDGGRHAWTVHLQEMQVGVVRDASASEAKVVRREAVAGNSVLVRYDSVSRFAAGSSEAAARALEGYSLGSDGESWALASDGVMVHAGEALGFGGAPLRAGDAVVVLLDLHAGTLAFSLRGRQLGAEMRGVRGPVVPAVSVTRARTCTVTLADYCTM